MGKQQGGLDLAKLRKLQKGIKEKAGKGGGIMLYSNKLTEEVDVRILPAPAIANGVYFVEQELWWVNKKTFLVNSTEILGGVDVIQEEVDAARATGDKDLIALIEKKDGKIPVLKKETRYLLPILLLDAKFNDNGSLASCEVSDTKVLVAKPTLLFSINEKMTARQNQNGTLDGMLDRVQGRNLILSKTGAGINTEYSSMAWNTTMEMDKKYYEKIPNVFEMTQKASKTDAYLRSVIRNYLYGEEVLEEEEANNGKEALAKSAKPSRKVAETPKEEEPKKEIRGAAKTEPKKTTPAKRSLLDDAQADMGDEGIDDL